MYTSHQQVRNIVINLHTLFVSLDGFLGLYCVVIEIHHFLLST